MPKHRKNVPMTPKAGKAKPISKKEFDEGLDAALRATQPDDTEPSFSRNNLETKDD